MQTAGASCSSGRTTPTAFVTQRSRAGRVHELIVKGRTSRVGFGGSFGFGGCFTHCDDVRVDDVLVDPEK